MNEQASRPDHPRAAAALADFDVLARGRALDDALAQRLAGMADGRDRALAQEIAYGVLRWLPRLRTIAGALMERPLKGKDADLECLLLGGLYQLLYLRVPEHAAVSETVGAARVLDKPWAARLLNGVLRGFQRRREQLLADVAHNADADLCFPRWLRQRLERSWPADWADIIGQSNQRPPMTLRVHRGKSDVRAYAATLAAVGITARPLRGAAQALVLDRPVDAAGLPGFAEGLVSVQDGAAQLAAPLLEPAPDHVILDACAAPGGKTAHILELAPQARVTAVDVSEERLEPLRSNLQRLGLSARVLTEDVADAGGQWNDRRYDRILLDVPCSATGVIRRHPDIKWLRRGADIDRLLTTQRRILDTVWPALAEGGMLLYVTCSLLAEENHEQMRAFVADTRDARELPIAADWGQPCPIGRQVLPGENHMDGFYFARLCKSGPRQQ